MSFFAKFFLPLMSAAFISCALFAVQPAVAATSEFSATIISTSDGHVSDGKIFYTKRKQRMEVRDRDSGDRSIIIVRLDKGVAWMLMPSQMMYMEMSLDQQKKMATRDPDKVIERRKVGVATIDGHPTVKERVTFKDDNGDRETYYWWYATDISWPVKEEALDGSWSQEYRNIKFAAQAASLFEIPAGYTRMETPRPRYNEPDYEPPSAPEPEYPGHPSPPTPYIPGPPSIPTPW